MDLLAVFAANMKRIREEKGLSQEALGAEADVHRTFISGVERCVRNPTVRLIEKIAKGLGVPPADLFELPAGQSKRRR